VPLSLLALAVLLQIVALVARSEAWNVCVRAAGVTVNRRVLFRAAARRLRRERVERIG
jgi:hypothetical protein